MSDALEELTALAQERAERERLLVQRAAAKARQLEAQQRVATAREQLTAEQGDVEALESVSMTRILAALRGRRDMDLDRERAEAAAAQYAFAEAEARALVEDQHVASIDSRLAAFGDLDTRQKELLESREREVRADPGAAATAGELQRVAEQVGRLRAQEVELQEADTAARRAHEALRAAADLLGSARSWSTYDTFFGGGMIADLVKHDKLDQAGRLMRAADAALGRLATELADVGVQPVGEVGIPQLTRALDVWFDNIFSDWAVRDRIDQARGRVDVLLSTVGQIGTQLASRRTAVTAEISELERQREQLLSG